MVLIVVLSVHNGFERNLKEMLLGFSPHITVVRADGSAIEDWEDQENNLSKFPEVESAYALVQGFALLDSKLWQQPVTYRAVHSGNVEQTASLTALLDLENYPGGRADMGLEPNAVISRTLAKALGLTIGDEIRVLAAGNMDSVMEVYNVPDDRIWNIQSEVFENFESVIKAELIDADGQETIPTDAIVRIHRELAALLPSEDGEGVSMRRFEREKIGQILDLLQIPVEAKEGRDYFPSGTREAVLAMLDELKNLDLKEADNWAFRQIEEFVKPQTFTVWGVYADTDRVQGPSLLIPLEIGMELKKLRGASEAIGVVTGDPYHAEELAVSLQEELGREWSVRSWMRTHEGQFQLMKTEKVMMSFALSFITILSAFSIMAVMYTVTVQKRQEIGVMKALGARSSQIVKVFLYQGIIVGIGGAALGVGLGLLAIHNRENIANLLRSVGIDPFPADFQGMNELPALVVPVQLLIICAIAIVLCILAALVPALMAAFRDPAKSLRNL